MLQWHLAGSCWVDTHGAGQQQQFVAASTLDTKAYLEYRGRQSKACNELAGQVCQVDEAAHVCLLHQLELVPQAVLQRHPVGFAGGQQALQQVHIVWVPAALLQAALHTHPHHLPL